MICFIGGFGASAAGKHVFVGLLCSAERSRLSSAAA